MKRYRYIVAGLSLAASLAGCSDPIEPVADARAITFSIPCEWPGDVALARSDSPAVFAPGDGISVFACYTPQADGAASSFVANFMRNQLVSFDGSVWSYSPVKYWPANGAVAFRGYYPYNAKYNGVDNGLPTIDHQCKTALEPLYAARAEVKAESGVLSGDGIGENGRLQLLFAPLLNKVNFTARAADGLFDEPGSGEYTDCRFLIKEFRVWGFYKAGSYDMATEAWSGRTTAYTAREPLAMTEHLDRKHVAEEVPGYVYAPDQGYRTDEAVVIGEGKPAENIFGKSTYFIPMDGVIAGNDPGFEVVYVVLTSKPGGTDYKESGVVTRSGSLREIFADRNGLIKKIINVNLEFSVDGVTVTREFTDYKYKPMF